MKVLLLAARCSGKAILAHTFDFYEEHIKFTNIILGELTTIIDIPKYLEEDWDLIITTKMSDKDLSVSTIKFPYEMLAKSTSLILYKYNNKTMPDLGVVFDKNVTIVEWLITTAKCNIRDYYASKYLLKKYEKKYYDLDLLGIPTGAKINPYLPVFDDIRGYLNPIKNNIFYDMEKVEDLHSLQEYASELQRLVKEIYNREIFIDVNYMEDELNKYLVKLKKLFELDINKKNIHSFLTVIRNIK